MRQFSIVNALLLLVIIALGLFWMLDRRMPSPQARFQLQATPNRAFILDTITGQAWEQVLQQGALTSPSTPEFLQPKPTDK